MSWMRRLTRNSQRLGIADVHAAVQGGHHYCLRHPVPLLVADRFSELLLDRIDGGLVLLDGRAPQVAQPVSVQVAQQGPQRLRRVQQILLGGRDLRRNPFQQRLAYPRWSPVAEPPSELKCRESSSASASGSDIARPFASAQAPHRLSSSSRGSEVGIGFLDLVTGTHCSTLTTGHASDHALRDLGSRVHFQLAPDALHVRLHWSARGGQIQAAGDPWSGSHGGADNGFVIESLIKAAAVVGLSSR